MASDTAAMLRTVSVAMGVVHEICRGVTTCLTVLKTFGEDYRLPTAALVLTVGSLAAYLHATAEPGVDREQEGYYSPWTARTSRGLGQDEQERTDALSRPSGSKRGRNTYGAGA